MSKIQPNEHFASRDTLEEAIGYADELLTTLPDEHYIVAYTAMSVVRNTALKELNKRDLSSVLPRKAEDLPTSFRIPDISPDLAAVLVRSNLISAIRATKAVAEFPIIGPLGENLTAFILLVSRMYSMTIDDVIAETKADIGATLSTRE
jgi:putative N-acetylmannosamine-6-phosphate epimerase